MNFKKIHEITTKFIKEKVEGANAEGVIIGLSGGIDSAVTAKLCVDAIGNMRVFAIIMPTKVTPECDISDAAKFAKELGIKYKIMNISKILDSFLEDLNEIESTTGNKTAIGNLMARTRMCLIYYHANLSNRIVAGTGNRSELLCGYFTKFGDGGCDFLPIGNLYKTEVKKLAEYIEIPEEIINKTPSAGLRKGQSDEEDLGISYKLLDKILIELVDKKTGCSKISEKLKIDNDEVKRIEKLIKNSEHKRYMPEICVIERNC